ncbi:MAG: ABC transporter permease [Cyanobacteria bacterium P01_H01_bin.74]
MIQLVLKRLLAGLVTLVTVITLTFFLLRLMPGGPFDTERKLPPAIRKNLEEQYYLKKPVFEQYILYMKNIVRGNLGPSFKYRNRSVNQIVSKATWISFQLGVLALALGIGMGIFFGLIAGLTRHLSIDTALTVLGISAVSTPQFIFGGLLVLIFSLTLKLLPAATLQSGWHYCLPVVTLALSPFAFTFLLIRNSVKEIKTQLHVVIKKSQGLSMLRIAVAHILRNALIPLVSVIGPISAAIITGSFAVEYIFAIPGLGKHFITAVTNRDYTLVMGITLIYGLALIVLNMLTDIVYGILDPRLREGQ